MRQNNNSQENARVAPLFFLVLFLLICLPSSYALFSDKTYYLTFGGSSNSTGTAPTEPQIRGLGFNTTVSCETGFMLAAFTNTTATCIDYTGFASASLVSAISANTTELNITLANTNSFLSSVSLNTTALNITLGNTNTKLDSTNNSLATLIANPPTASVPIPVLGKKYIEFNDFQSITTAYTRPWIPGAIASGTTALLNSQRNHPGIANTSCANAVANGGYFFQMGAGAQLLLRNNTYTYFVFYPQCNRQANVNATTSRIGFMDSFTATQPVDALFMNATTYLNGTACTYAINFMGRNNNVWSVNNSFAIVPGNMWYSGLIYINSSNYAYMNLYNENQTLVTQLSLYNATPAGVGRETSHGFVTYVNGSRITAQGLGLIALDYLEVGANETIVR